MLGLALSLASAASWGVSDFLGGLQTRRLPVLTVLAVSQPVGLVLILGLGLILLGVAFMLIMRARQPAFFRGETLRKDTPVLVVDEP